MGILDQLADFGSEFADTYFGVGKMMQADDVGRDRAAQEYERARGARRVEDFNQLLFGAQQDIPDFFRTAADTTNQQNRQRRSVARRAADMGDIDLDQRFRTAMDGVDPSSADYRERLADYMASRGWAPEALRYADDARTRADADLLLPLLSGRQLSREQLQRLGLADEGPEPLGLAAEPTANLSSAQRLILAQLLGGNNPGVQSLSRAAQATAQQRNQLTQNAGRNDSAVLSALARSNPELAVRLQALMQGRQIPQGMSLGTPQGQTPARTGRTGQRSMYSSLNDIAGFEVTDKNAPLVRRAVMEAQLAAAESGRELSPQEMQVAVQRRLEEMQFETVDPALWKRLQERRNAGQGGKNGVSAAQQALRGYSPTTGSPTSSVLPGEEDGLSAYIRALMNPVQGARWWSDAARGNATEEDLANLPAFYFGGQYGK